MATPGPEWVVSWPTLGFLVADWVEQHCIVPDGWDKGRPFEMYDWQLWCTVNHYRVKPTATVGQLATAFHYRRSQIIAPQKALALDTPIATPTGWTTMGEVRPGDDVFDERGEPTRAISKSPVWLSDTYRVTFSDGASLVACGDHQWWVERRTPSGTYVPDRVTTTEMAANLVDGHGARRYRVPNAEPLRLPDVDLPIDPYVLGAWLGDGHSDDARITGLDEEIFARIEAAGHEVRRTSVPKRRQIMDLKPLLRKAGLLRNKHIPVAYLRASEKQRWALLQGLMDTDGYADVRQGKCEFTTTLPALRDGVRELLYSLGIRHLVHEGIARLNGRATGPKWRIDFAARSDMPVFHLPRKQQRLKPPGRGHAQYRHRRVIAVEQIATVPTQCLTVEAPSHVFLAGREMIPTCNTGKGPWSATIICNEAVGPAVFAGWAKGGEVWDCRDHGCDCGWVWEYEPGDPMATHWPTPLIQLLATSEDQVGNVYRPLQAMAKHGPLASMMRVGEGFIRLPSDGKVDVVTSSAQSRLGNPIIFALQDETGLYTATNKMIRVAETQRRGAAGMGGRSMETTNAPDPSEGSVAQRTLESKRPDIFRFWQQAPASLRYHIKSERRKIHKYVYRGSAHVDLDAIEAEAAELLEKDPGQAERFFGNRMVSGIGTWLDAATWNGRAAKTARKVADGTRIVLGFDGSDSDDWTGIRAETLDGFQFTPTFGPDRLPTIWNPADYGGQVPRLEVAAAVDDLMARYDVVRLYADPPEWETEVDGWAEQYGEKVVIRWYTRRAAQMYDAAERLLTDVTKADSAFTHDGCETTATHVGNTRKARRPGNKYVLAKASQSQKIDLTVCSILAHQAAGDVIAAGLARPKKSSRMLILR
ncbi:hypothetical protein NE236_41395 [Actinoallomurus purpureus]|uniref:LAGLIDADG family homing endonuclease n=1 Tax=Actinoallomurus purpureus TaxID=478114 RepID=UPI00209301A7|nr:LAGLIDADG family homing endonuclease [Actinoallomurus purpureus]MCO6011425.1 hypothetical protein [Actinoallomurus purpureus]